MKTYLGKGGLTGKTRVFLAADCLEIEQERTVDVVRQRIYLDDVLMVTHSRRLGWLFLAYVGAVSGVCALTSLGFLLGKHAGVAALFFIAALGCLIPFGLRLLNRLDVITIFGRRLRTEITFGRNKADVRRHYEAIVSAVRGRTAVTQARIDREKATLAALTPVMNVGPSPEPGASTEAPVLADAPPALEPAFSAPTEVLPTESISPPEDALQIDVKPINVQPIDVPSVDVTPVEPPRVIRPLDLR